MTTHYDDDLKPAIQISRVTIFRDVEEIDEIAEGCLQVIDSTVEYKDEFKNPRLRRAFKQVVIDFIDTLALNRQPEPTKTEWLAKLPELANAAMQCLARPSGGTPLLI